MIAIFPEIAASAATGDVESLAILVRRYFGGTQTFAPKPQVDALIQRFGLTLKRTALPMHGALLAKDERGAFTIVMVVQERSDALAERFLLAHLLGHYLLDVQPLIARGDWQVSGYQESIHPLDRYGSASALAHDDPRGAKVEARADQFAAALLLPRGMLRKALGKLQDPAKVAAFFGVTAACLARRLQELSGTHSGPVDFFDAEQQIGQGHLAAPAIDQHGATLAGLSVPPDGAMPRSYAASTYGATEKATRRVPPAAAAVQQSSDKAPVSPVAAVPGSRPSSQGGMDRLRELARRLDKGPKAKT